MLQGSLMGVLVPFEEGGGGGGGGSASGSIKQYQVEKYYRMRE